MLAGLRAPEAAARAAPSEPQTIRCDRCEASSKAAPAFAFALGEVETLACAEVRFRLVVRKLGLLLPSACTIFASENGMRSPATNTIPI